MPDVLIVADTFRSPEMRHEVPAPVPDAFLYAEVGGTRHVMAPTHEEPIISAAGEYVFHAPEEYGVEELRRTKGSVDEMFQELIVRTVRSLGMERAVVPGSFPLFADSRKSVRDLWAPGGLVIADFGPSQNRADNIVEVMGDAAG